MLSSSYISLYNKMGAFATTWMRVKLPLKPSLMPITLAFLTSFLVVAYLSLHLDITFSQHTTPPLSPSPFPRFIKVTKFRNNSDQLLTNTFERYSSNASELITFVSAPFARLHDHANHHTNHHGDDDEVHGNYNNESLPTANQQQLVAPGSPSGSSKSKPNNDKHKEEDHVFHDEELFLENYKEMKRLKIYIYPPKKHDPFAKVFLPQNGATPGGNYASEAYFKNLLFKSRFITRDPSAADLFFLPFSIASLRHDRRVGVDGLQDFIKLYMTSILWEYCHWNASGGADHFYVACHSIGRIAMDKVEHVKANAIQVVCSSSYFLRNYYAHKDVSLPQVWPRHENHLNLTNLSKRKRLAVFAGAMNSPVRKRVLEVWRNDTSIYAHHGRLKTPYSEQLLSSKYCLHLKGFEVNTARVVDALFYGCVPVILADYYDLPFMDILNWKSFSVVVTTSDIPNLRKILEGITPERYATLQANVLKVRKHFQWNANPVEFDTFYMVMYELWLRRSAIRVIT